MMSTCVKPFAHANEQPVRNEPPGLELLRNVATKRHTPCDSVKVQVWKLKATTHFGHHDLDN